MPVDPLVDHPAQGVVRRLAHPGRRCAQVREHLRPEVGPGRVPERRQLSVSQEQHGRSNRQGCERDADSLNRLLGVAVQRAAASRTPASAFFSMYLHANLFGPTVRHCAPMSMSACSTGSAGEPDGNAASSAACAEGVSAKSSKRKLI